MTDVFSSDNDGSLPIGTYKGNHLNLQSLTSAGCAYTPGPIQTAYNLTGLYAEGFQGQGQTIVILDWCGSPTIQNDANAFSAMFGLPLLSSSNFNIIYTPTPSLCEAPDSVEINIDVEWSHAVAPMANIDLVVPPSASFQDVNEAEYFAVNYGLGNVVSGSYGSRGILYSDVGTGQRKPDFRSCRNFGNLHQLLFGRRRRLHGVRNSGHV